MKTDRLYDVIQATAKAKWAGSATELELYARASQVADRIRARAAGADEWVTDLSEATLTQIQRDLLNEGRKPATVNRIMSAFGTAMKFAQAQGVAAPTMPQKLREGGRDGRALTQEEWRRITLKIRSEGDFRTELIAAFLHATGLRVGEVLGLTNDSFSTHWTHVTVIREKSGQESRLPLSTLAQAAAEDLYGNYIRLPDYQQFLRSWRAAVLSALGEYGPELGPHVLRRTFATEMSRKGVPIRVIQHMLGHRSVRTTERYIAVTEEDILKALEI